MRRVAGGLRVVLGMIDETRRRLGITLLQSIFGLLSVAAGLLQCSLGIQSALGQPSHESDHDGEGNQPADDDGSAMSFQPGASLPKTSAMFSP